MVSEKKYHELVAAWLAESFADVEHEVTLESMRRPDFIAHTPFDSYIIEVENDWHGIKDGLGQCVMYGAETGMKTVLVLPADDVDEYEMEFLQKDRSAPIIETV